MTATNPPTRPRHTAWLLMGSESYGVQRINSGMWKYLVRAGFNFDVVTMHDGDLPRVAESMGRPTYVVNRRVAADARMRGVRSVRAVRLMLDTLQLAVWLRRHLRRRGIELVQVSDIDLMIGARLAVLGTGVRICYLTPNRPPGHRVARRVFPLLMRGKRIVVLANSDDIRERFADAGVACSTLLLGVDLEEFSVPDDPPRPADATTRFVTIARLCEAKAQDLWVGAVLALLDAGHDVSLAVVGGEFEPGFEARLRHMAAESTHPDRIQFLGPRSDVPQLLQDADVALCGQRELEPFGLAGVEALACRRPVVALGEGGIREFVIPGRSGWHCPSATLSDVTATLQGCLDDRARWTEFGANGREDVEARFSLRQVVDTYLELVTPAGGVRV